MKTTAKQIGPDGGKDEKNCTLCEIGALLFCAGHDWNVFRALSARPVRAFFFIVAGLIGSSARAQSAAGPQASAQADDRILFEGSFRTRVEVWNWFEADTGANSYAFSGNVLKLSASQSKPSFDWKVEFEVPFLLGLPANAVASGAQGQLGMGGTYYASNLKGRNTAMIFPKQVFVRWKRLAGVQGQSLRIGRFEEADGAEHTPADGSLATVKRDHINQRLIGPFGFTHVGQSFDGLEYSFDRRPQNFTFWAAVPDRGAFQTDGWGWLKIAFAYGAYTRDWGKGAHAAETRLFGIEYVDWRNILKVDNRPLAVRQADTGNIRLETVGGHSLHSVTTHAGDIDWLGWGAFQFGRWGAQLQRAYAFDVETGFQPAVAKKLKPWVRAGLTIGSGSGNPDSRDHGTFFQMLPTARIYARFPFFNMMNIQDRFGALILRPHSKLTISSECHSLRLDSRQDLWYSGGGPYQPWSFGYAGRDTGGARSLANLYDTQADWRVNAALSATVYFGYAQGLAAIQAVYPRGRDGQFGFVEMTYRFSQAPWRSVRLPARK